MEHFKHIARLSPEYGRYFANCHEDDKNVNKERFNLLKNSTKLLEIDGLNSLSYTVTDVLKNKLFTKLTVTYD